MAKLLHYSSAGNVVGFFDQDFHSEIPNPVLEISEQQWRDHIDGNVTWAVDVDGPDPVLVEYVPPAPSLAEIKASAASSMIRWIDQLTATLKEGYAADEIASWPSKAIEARAVLSGGDVGPLLSREAARRGMPVADLAVMIDGHASVFEAIMGEVAGLRGATYAAIEAATDADEVDAVLQSAKASAIAAATELGVSAPEAD